MALTRASAAVVKTEEIIGSRNRIINGAMEIDQRNAGASANVNTWTVFSSDRFICGFRPSRGTASAQRSTTAPSGFRNSLQLTQTSVTSAAADDYYTVSYRVEGYDVADFDLGLSTAKTFTLSFWVRSSVTGVYALTFQNNAADPNRRSYITTYTINAANTWEYKTITITGDTTGTWETTNLKGMEIIWDLGSGSSYQSSTLNAWQSANAFQTSTGTRWIGTSGATFFLTGVQLELGSVATTFEHRPFGTELQLCQRYYEKSFDLNSIPQNGSNSTSFAAGARPRWRVDWSASFTAGTVNTPQMFMVPKRAQPTITQYGNSSGQANVLNFSGGTNTWQDSTSTPAGELSFQQYINAGFSNGQWGIVYFAYAASAEL